MSEEIGMGLDGQLDLKHELSEATLGKLLPRGDIREANWHFWEKRNLNLHRAVALCTYGSSSAQHIETQVRETLGRHFRCAWWRGFGFGVVVELRDAAAFPEQFEPLIDGRANPKGTWQWMILVSRHRRKAWGLHTWIEGYLSPAYRGLLMRLEEQGYEITSVRKEKDGLMKLLTASKPRDFPDFENDFGGTERPVSRP